MLTLQKSFSYAGDSATKLIRSVNIVFDVPVFGYFDVGGDKDARLVDRTIAATKEVSISLAIDAKDYRVDLGSDFVVGRDKSMLALVKKYYADIKQVQQIEGLIVPVGVRYLTVTGASIGEQKLELIHYPKLDLQKSTDIVRASAANLLTSERLTFIAINKQAYFDILRQLAKADLTVDEILLLEVISYLTDIRGDAPGLQKLSTAQKNRLMQLLEMGSLDSAKRVLEVIVAAFPALYDFPLNVPEVKGLKIAGKLTILAPANDLVSADDFKLYELTAEYTMQGSNELQLLRYPLGSSAEIRDASFSFKFPAGHLQSSVTAPVVVTVKDFDGSISWSKGFQPDDSELSALEIEVDLQKPVTLDSGANVDANDKTKKLRGQVLEFSKKCSIKGLTVVIQAKADGDLLWRIVGAATTDTAGRFTIPYPYGIYTEAQAIVSAAPDDPATIGVTAVRDGDQTIVDDFLYLLVKEFNCPDRGDDEDRHCGDVNKSSRLPDQAELIGSKEYTQDLGGSCVNLSTPNRTLSEFDYQAIVRTSDPAVSNYVLRRVETGIDAIDANVAVLLANGARALEAFTTATRSTLADLPPEVANGIMAWSISHALNAAWPHVYAISQSLNSSSVTHSVLNATLHRIDAAAAFVTSIKPDTRLQYAIDFLEKTDNLRSLVLAAIDAVGGSARYELSGGTSKRNRKPIDLDNLVAWQDDNEHLSLYQAVTVATGHILHYKSEFRADGYSMGDLIYSLPLAPGQKKEIVVFDSSHRLTGAESQSLSQGERLAAGIVDERVITSQLGGRIAESLRGSSSANTSGISAGFGTGGQGSGGTGAYGGSGSAVIGVAGGVANSNSIAAQDSSRDISQFFQERLRQSIMQNADSYRQQNASVVTTVQEGQQYGVTSEVVANHNHCHALTMMYFEVLRHYAVFQRLSGVEECVFVPLLMTNFTTENMYRWRDVLAQFLLPMPAETYLQSYAANRQHPLLKAFDANERIKTNYANIDYPTGSYDEEPIRFIRGAMQLRVSLPRPRTRFDRIMSLPVTTQTYTTKEIDPQATAAAALDFPRKMAEYAAKVGATAGLLALFERPPVPPGVQYSTTQHEMLVREAIFDSFMSLDANYQTVPPAECIRITNFKPPATISGLFGNIRINASTVLDFFADNDADRRQWTAYATILGYTDVLTMLNAYFKGNLISEWDTIFNNEIAPLIFERIVARIRLSEFASDFSSQAKYRGGERTMRLNLTGSTSKKRNQLPDRLSMAINDTAINSISDSILLYVENLSLTYSTAHYNGMLYSGSVNDDLLDGIDLYIPENADEKRNPRKDDACLVYKLIEHLNSNLEYYNKTLWHNLDPDRRYMLLDGFSIQTYNERGRPVGLRSLASVVKNDLITVTGNSLVFPVASGYKVSNAYIVPKTAEPDAAPVTLFDHYQPLTPMEPYRISVPSRGVFGEAVQGACNACEKIETERLQDWTKFPNTDEPTPIATVTTPVPSVTDWQAAFKDFATPIVNIQNAPVSPAPGAGLAGLADLLGKSGVFKDITGLDANQQNAIKTYLSNQENAKAFAEMAKEMAMQQHNTQNSGKIMDSIASAKQSGTISNDDASKLTKDHLQQQIDGGATKKVELENSKEAAKPSLSKAAVDAASQGKSVKAQQADGDGNTESVEIGGTTDDSADADGDLSDNLSKYSTPEQRAFNPHTANKTGATTLRAVVPGAPAGSTWHWSVADATKAQIRSPKAYTTEVLAGHPGLVNLTFEALDPGGTSIAKTVSQLSVPQFVAVYEDSLALNGVLVGYKLDDVRDAVLARVKDVADFLLQKANVRTIWTIAPFNETLPAQFAAGGFADGKYNKLTIRGTNAVDPSIAGETGAAGAGAAKPDEPIDVWPGAYRTPGTDVGVEITALVAKMAAMTMTDPDTKTLWIEIMGRLIGETIAHEIHHALLALAIPTGHNSPSIPWDLMNRGAERSFIQRTGIEVLSSANFPQPGSYRDGGVMAISGVLATNQALVDAVFPVPPVFR